LNNSISLFIERIWKKTGLSQEFSGSLKQALFFSGTVSDPRKTHLAKLPEICCQAAGGDPPLAGPVLAAWLLFNRAARIMDSVQDGDMPEAWWKDHGLGYALNVASAFFFTASNILADLEINGIPSQAAGAVRRTFSRLFIRMCEGQHLDLTASTATLDDYWKIVHLKSGLFFAIACRSGAELALNDELRLNAFETFGNEIGILIQILDDLEEFQFDQKEIPSILSLKENSLSLPLSYAFTILPEEPRLKLLEKIEQANHDASAVQSVLDTLDQIGVAAYVSMELTRHAALAQEALAQAYPIEPFRGILADIVKGLVN
jgi:geranylgeranyl pyrophosphate synthase